MLRFEVQSLAIETLGFEGQAGDIAEQAEPVEHLRHWLMAAQVLFASGARFGTFAFVGQRSDVRQQGGGVLIRGFRNGRQWGHGSKRAIAHNRRWRRIAQRLADRHGDRFRCRQWFRVRFAVTTERERLGNADRTHAQAAEQAALGGADKQHAVEMRQALEHFEHLLLGWLVEIDQQVAAEHKIERRLTGQ